MRGRGSVTVGAAFGRRQLVKAAVAGAAVGAASSGSLRVAAAGPSTQSGAITLNWAVNFQGVSWTDVQAHLTQELLAQYWAPARQGVRVNLLPNLDATPAISAVLAGSGPDILQGCCRDLPSYLQAGIVLPLDPLLHRDNIDAAALFSPGHLAALRTGAGQMALPAYDGPQVLLVNEGTLDSLGLRYPAPDWTADDAVRLWEAAAAADPKAPGGWRYGVTLQWYAGGWGGYWLSPGWGGDWIDPTLTKPLFNSPATVAGVRWITDLFSRKVAVARAAPSGWIGGWTSVQNGQSVMGMAGGWDSLAIAQGMQGVKWNYYQMPVFPSGQRTTMINVDFLAMNSGTRYPELAWDLFKFVAIGKPYQAFSIRTTLVNPSRVDMWDQWEQIVSSVAPPMRGKNLSAYHDAVSYAHAHRYFKYEPVAADQLIGQSTARMGPPLKGDVIGILQQLNNRLTALEATGPALQSAAEKELQLYRTYLRKASGSAAAVRFPAPPRNGSGLEPTAANRLAAVSADGTYTLEGAGAGVLQAADDCTFAGAAYRLSKGTFTCRVVAISAVKDTAIADGAKIGLMARSNLSDDAAGVGLEVAMGRGLHFHVRSVDGQTLADNQPSSDGAPTGLIGKNLLLADDSKPAKNYLLKPVWLRLVLDGANWTPYTSLDGLTWTQANPPGGVEFVGAWVGLYVTSHKAGHFIRAVFDHLSGFRPDTFVQVGRP